MRQNASAARSPPCTLLGELTALPRPPSWIWGKRLEREKMKGLVGRDRTKGRREMRRGDGEKERRGRDRIGEERGEVKGRIEKGPQVFQQHDAPDNGTVTVNEQT